jgi:phenylalanyl-tRNA synthetase beta chain
VVFRPAQICWAKTGAQICIDKKIIGSAGIVSDTVCKEFDIEGAQLCAAEVDFDFLAAMENVPLKLKPIARFPAISRDISFIVDESLLWSEMKSVIESAAPAELEEIRFEGIYGGKPIPPAKKSVTVSLRFRDEQGTLKHETVDRWETTIIETCNKKLASEIRK